jgi:signal peptidase II
MQRYLVLLVVPFIFALDRWTKTLIEGGLAYLEMIPVTSFFSIVHARNTGGVFGFLAGHSLARAVFTVLPIIIMAGLIYVLLRYRISLSKRMALACILGGAFGNMYDRIFYGYVTDFLDFFYGGYHWPAFNVADIAITTGISLWLFSDLFLSRGKGLQSEKQKVRSHRS